MNFLVHYGYQIMIGTMITISSWIVAGFLSFTIGMTLGVIGSRFLATRSISLLIRLYTFVAKGVPAYVHILIAYFVLPAVIGVNISSFFAANLALAFCSSGYVTEIIRAGINGVPRGQWQACSVLGYSLMTALRRIIVPQAIKNSAPALFGEFEQLLKSTSLLATIGVTELTRTGMNIISRELNPVPVYLTIACIYLIISALLQCVAVWLEKRLHYGGH